MGGNLKQGENALLAQGMDAPDLTPLAPMLSSPLSDCGSSFVRYSYLWSDDFKLCLRPASLTAIWLYASCMEIISTFSTVSGKKEQQKEWNVVLLCKWTRTLPSFANMSISVGPGGSAVDSVPCVWKVAGLNPILATMQGSWASPSLTVAHSAWHVNSDTVSML